MSTTEDDSTTSPTPEPSASASASVCLGSTVDLKNIKTSSVWGYLTQFTFSVPEGNSSDMEGDSTYIIRKYVRNLGDINGDSRTDFAIGIPRYTYNSNVDSGAVFIVYGQDFTEGSSHVLDTEIGTAVEGVVLGGESAQDHLGQVDSGDVNNDGAKDVIVSAMQYLVKHGTSQGRIYAILSNSGSPISLSSGKISDLSSVMTINHSSGYLGSGLAVGNIDGDGSDDVLIGAPAYYDKSTYELKGGTFLCRGSSSSPALPTTTIGCTHYIPDDLTGRTGQLAETVAIGDFDGDGCGDILMGDRGANDYGSAYLVFQAINKKFGRRICRGFSTYGTSNDLTNIGVLGANIPGIKFVGETLNSFEASERAGAYLSFVGDVNADGFEDIVITAYDYSRDKADYDMEGAFHLIYGQRRKMIASSVSLADVETIGYSYRGASKERKLGKSVYPAGDVNADGTDDYIVTDFTRRAYLVFGSSTKENFDKDITSGTNVVTIYNSDYSSGNSNAIAGGIGDINQDGYDDIIMGLNTSASAMTFYIVPGGCFISP